MTDPLPPAGKPVRRPKRAVAVAGLVVVAAAVVFVVENSQRVTVHLWVVTGHPRLIWVLLVTLVVGAVAGVLATKGSRRRPRQRS